MVLGVRSYEAVKNSDHTQAVMRALGITKSFLFIGCGDEGLADPNFGHFLTWLAAIEADGGVEHRHYRLVREQDVFEPQGRLYPLVYGKDYGELPRFLERLRPQAERLPGDDRKKAAVRVLAPLPKNIAHYLDCLAGKTATITLLGMGRSLQVELPIDEAYVPLRTTMARSLEQRPSIASRMDMPSTKRAWTSGKCSARQPSYACAASSCSASPDRARPRAPGNSPGGWPVGRVCRRTWGCPPARRPCCCGSATCAGRRWRTKTGCGRSSTPRRSCDEAPDALASPGPDLWNGGGGGLLWILDGLDEVIDPEARKKVSGWVRKALEGRPQDYFLVTCRFQGYFREGVSLGPKFVEFHVRPLDDQQIERFVRDWFCAAYRKLLGPGPRATLRAQEDGDALLEILARPAYQAGHIRELCTNPLLLTILCIVFHEERKLPTGRAELYAHCVRVLLEYWRRDLYTAELGTSLKPYDAEAAQAVLGRLAWWMHQQQDRTAAPLGRVGRRSDPGTGGRVAEFRPGQ